MLEWKSGLAVVVATMGFFGSSAFAQIIPPSEQPGREQQRFNEPATPRAQPGTGGITLPSTVAPPGAATTSVLIRGIRISGSTIYKTSDFLPLYEDLLGKTVALQAVYDLARKITAKYGNDGYVLSRAIVPPQQLNPKGAVIEIQVIEGYVDKVEWPQSLSRYRDFFSDYAVRIKSQRPANIRTIERYILLAGDLPGLKFATSLRASADNSAASTLVVEVTEKPIDANGKIDNRGTKARGPIQYLASTTLNNLFGQHEALTISWAAVQPIHELQYFSATYRQVLTSEGMTFFANASNSWGRPGTAQLELLDFRTRGSAFDAGLAYPIVRSREANLTISALAFASNNHSDILDAPFNQDNLRGGRARIDADIADALQGINQFNVTFSQGFRGLGSSDNGNPLASRAAGRVDFNKIEGSANRTQPLFDSFSAYIAVYGQYASTPLLSPEQCGYGGRFFGRAFDPSQLLGDSCIQALGELRYDLQISNANGSQFQIYGFSDWGYLTTRDAALGTAAHAQGASVGGGLRLGHLDLIKVDLQAAKGIDGPRDDWRFFFSVTARH